MTKCGEPIGSLWQCRRVESANSVVANSQIATSGDPITEADTFPRQYARTRRFSLGEPRSFQIAPDGRRIVFLRSGSSSDAINRLYVLERTGQGGWIERCVFDPSVDAMTGDQSLTAQERARRERMRETSSGITSFDVDRGCSIAVFVLGGSLHTVDLTTNPDIDPNYKSSLCTLMTPEGPYDPRLSPDGKLVAFVADRALHLCTSDGSLLPGSVPSMVVASDDNEEVSWGIADFNAAEEFDRYRGFWWSPDSKAILAARVDNSPVETWWIADPANPANTPVSHRYPAAGTANAIVTLATVEIDQLLTTGKTKVQSAGITDSPENDHQCWPYLVHASWTEAGCTAVWMNRDQTSQITVAVKPGESTVNTLSTATNEAWVERCPGTPIRLSNNRLLHADVTPLPGSTSAESPDTPTASPHDVFGTQYLVVADTDGVRRPITPLGLQVRRVVSATETHVIFTANASQQLVGEHSNLPTADPGAVSVFRIGLDGTGLALIAGGADVGVHDVVATNATGEVQVIRSASVNRTRAEHRIVVEGETQHMVETKAEIALVNPKPIFFRAGPNQLNCVAFLPSPGSPGDRKAKAEGHTTFPILMDPYAGPHAQRVVQSRNAHTTSQWFADQGFVVIVVDGRGTPGLGPNFERAVKGDLALGVLEDQIIGLHQAAKLLPQADLNRVGIRGWSFGGFLAGLAVLERPEVFHCAVVGAPVTEWRLYDTGYTERYLGNPINHPEIYDANSLLTRAHKLTRPMMLVHGLADDNVVAANTLQLSSALLAAGKAHEVLPLSGVTHMTPQEAVAENLLKLQVEFLNRNLR
jgi:dipeptidyl-peptidase 4